MTGSGETAVRRWFDAINRGSSADEVMAEIGDLLHADIAFVNPSDALEGGTRRGLDGIRTAVENYLAGIGPEGRFEIEQVIESGDEVFVRGRNHLRGVSSGIEVDGPGIGLIVTLRDGLIYRAEWSWDPDEALARFQGNRTSD
jgi:ketosteroid isomerase-like protein